MDGVQLEMETWVEAQRQRLAAEGVAPAVARRVKLAGGSAGCLLLEVGYREEGAWRG